MTEPPSGGPFFLAKETEEPPEVRFAGVFEAARVLLEDGADEDRVFPTLAWAGLEVKDGGGKRAELRAFLAEASGNPEEWEHLTRDLSGRTGRIKLLRWWAGYSYASVPRLR